jgi:thiamine transport system substrate-binding protein
VRSRLTVLLLGGVSLVFAFLFARQMNMSRNLPHEQFATKKFRILTYGTFVSATGPGGRLFDDFKKSKGCDIEVVTVSDAGLLLERLKLSRDPIDLVIGFDQLSVPRAAAEVKWKPIPAFEHLHKEVLLHGMSADFLPYDWSPMTFIFRDGTTPPPQNFSDLLDARFKNKFVLEDPRASSPGRQFFNWVKSVKGGDTAAFLEKFKPNVQSVAPSWSFAYGIFEKRQAEFVFSYLTSLAYHWGTDHDKSFHAVSLSEGHPVQVEYAAVPESCQQCGLAQDFLAFMMEAPSQKTIMERNYMLPAITGIEEGTVFAELPTLTLRPTLHSESKDLNEWDQVFKH